MQQKDCVFSPPLLVMIADQADRILFIHSDMQRFFTRPASGYVGSDVFEVLREITRKCPSPFSDHSGTVFPFLHEGENYCFSIEKMEGGGESAGTAVLLQKNGLLEKQVAYRFASVLNSGICILRHTEALTILRANEACYRFYGYTPEQFAEEKQNSPATLIHPQDRQMIKEKLGECLAAGTSQVAFEMRNYRRDGSMIWVEARITVLRQENTDILICLIWDISDKKRLESELFLSVQRYKIALSRSRNIIWEYHMDEDRAYIEDTTLSPFEKAAVIDHFSQDAFACGIVDKKYLPAFRQMFTDLKDGRQVTSALVRIRKTNGSMGWYRITHTMLHDSHGGGNIAVGVAEDVSEEQLAREKYRQEEKYRIALVGDALASYEIDIDHDTITEKIIEKNRDMLASVGLTVNCRYSEFLRRWAEKNVHPEDRQIFLQELDPGFLRRQYENGHQEVLCEYRSLNAEHEMIWCETTVYFITGGEHLNGFVYVKNVEKKKNRELELLRQSSIDPLTGLLNRAACLQRINEILMASPEQPGALLMIDVDDFKLVNDTFGHMYGDKVLAGIAYKLKTVFGGNAVVGRFGGDEFVVFMPGISSDSVVYEKAQIVARELQSEQKEGDRTVKVSNSIGIVFCPRHGVRFQELYVKADTALQHAKKTGKSCYTVFGSSISEVVPMNYVNREWLIDEMEEIVFVSDIQDYTLLYINRAGRELTGIQLEDFEKKKCYEVLQNRAAPCPFCTNAKLNKDQFYVWEFQNPYYKKNFIIKDKLVEWSGKLVRMEIAVDIGSRFKGDSELTSKYHLETVMLESLKLLNSADTLDEAINRTLALIGEFYGGERSYIIEIDREHGYARNTYEWCRDGVPSQMDSLQNVPLDAIPYIFEIFDKKQHLIISQVEELKDTYPSEYQFLTARRADSLFAVPFEDDSSFSGYVGVDNPNINQDTIRLLDSIAYNISSEIRKRRMYEKMEYEASHDLLTGLLNRSRYVKFHDELNRSRGNSCGVVTADINGLKLLNQNYGHGRGDMTIQLCAAIMKKAFPDDHIFRLSGDEFIIIALGQEYESFMRRVREMSEELEEQTPNGVSLGCTWEEHPAEPDRLIHHAEELMLVNKQLYYKTSSNVRKHFSPKNVQQLMQRLEEGCFKLYLQPKVNPENGEILSAEALVRYQEPGQQTVPPGKFIPALERVKLIRYLDFFMLEEVCRLLESWKREGRSVIPVSVNFSRITLLENDLFQVLSDIKSRYDIPPDCVMVEITESIGNIERKVIGAIGARLRKAGFKLSLDDFGADYANMSILSIIHFDEVKLDKSLIDNIVGNEINQTVVKGVIEMCRSLNVDCVAEGVETADQQELLKSFGCTAIQGYYYAKPVAAAEFETNNFRR